MIGYPHKLYILPFDHRGSLIKIFFGNIKELNKKQFQLMVGYRQLIFDGFLAARKKINNKLPLAILVDEQFGDAVIKSAKKKNIIVASPVEKSGQKLFTFEYGVKFGEHAKKLNPDIIKALVRYNPANKKINLIQLKRLYRLSSWCKQNKRKLMVELLVPPTKDDLKKSKNSQEVYSKKRRPRLTLKTINEFHAAGIEPDIWKIEAMEFSGDWPVIIEEIRQGEQRKNVAIILLGHGASFAKVKFWFATAPKDKLNGFAVGRTVFLRALEEFHNKKISRKQAVKNIEKNYLELINLWEKY